MMMMTLDLLCDLKRKLNCQTFPSKAYGVGSVSKGLCMAFIDYDGRYLHVPSNHTVPSTSNFSPYVLP